MIRGNYIQDQISQGIDFREERLGHQIIKHHLPHLLSRVVADSFHVQYRNRQLSMLFVQDANNVGSGCGMSSGHQQLIFPYLVADFKPPFWKISISRRRLGHEKPSSV
jgi:hypothetical protein